jgi:hypothetical protein
LDLLEADAQVFSQGRLRHAKPFAADADPVANSDIDGVWTHFCDGLFHGFILRLGDTPNKTTLSHIYSYFF